MSPSALEFEETTIPTPTDSASADEEEPPLPPPVEEGDFQAPSNKDRWAQIRANPRERAARRERGEPSEPSDPTSKQQPG